MRRSLLFVPGNNPGMIQNASLFDADCIIYDVEDAVAIEEKDSARLLLTYYLLEHQDMTSEIAVRMNAYDDVHFQKDFDALISYIDTIVVPKATVKDLQTIDLLCSKFDSKEKKIQLIPIIERAISLLEVEAIAALPRVSGILFGAEDFTSDIEVIRTKQGEEIAYARSRIAMACKAYKIDAIDTPCTDVTDEVLLIEDCKRAKTLAMNAKTCIHPNQVAVVNRMFAPSKEEIAYARYIIAQAKLHPGVGAFNVDGKMVDKPIIERCQKTLQKAKTYGLIDDEE